MTSPVTVNTGTQKIITSNHLQAVSKRKYISYVVSDSSVKTSPYLYLKSDDQRDDSAGEGACHANLEIQVGPPETTRRWEEGRKESVMLLYLPWFMRGAGQGDDILITIICVYHIFIKSVLK